VRGFLIAAYAHAPAQPGWHATNCASVIASSAVGASMARSVINTPSSRRATPTAKKQSSIRCGANGVTGVYYFPLYSLSPSSAMLSRILFFLAIVGFFLDGLGCRSNGAALGD
jgi:hypothetical protein